jgi:hypothetical protein
VANDRGIFYLTEGIEWVHDWTVTAGKYSLSAGVEFYFLCANASYSYFLSALFNISDTAVPIVLDNVTATLTSTAIVAPNTRSWTFHTPTLSTNTT